MIPERFRSHARACAQVARAEFNLVKFKGSKSNHVRAGARETPVDNPPWPLP